MNFATQKVILLWAALALSEVVASTNDQLAVRLESAATNLPSCLSRFVDYPASSLRLNPKFYLNDLDWSCVSPWNDAYGSQRAGVAISRRHLMFAKHFPISPGVRMTFVGTTGAVSHYTIKAVRSLPKCDIQIALLDYELTPDIHPAKVLPADFDKFLKEKSHWPVITFNQREQAYLSELVVFRRRGEEQMRFMNGAPKGESWKRFRGSLGGGDSGNPAFMLYANRPILIYCLTRGGTGSGTHIHQHLEEVQKAMDDLCPGYRLEKFDFAR